MEFGHPCLKKQQNLVNQICWSRNESNYCHTFGHRKSCSPEKREWITYWMKFSIIHQILQFQKWMLSWIQKHGQITFHSQREIKGLHFQGGRQKGSFYFAPQNYYHCSWSCMLTFSFVQVNIGNFSRSMDQLHILPYYPTLPTFLFLLYFPEQ